MKIKALFDVVNELPEATIIIELANKQKVRATGFWIKKDQNNKPIIVLKASEKSIK